MPAKPYGMICPIAHACDMLEPRWTIPILTELWAGSTRFNDLRRGIGNISPTLLSKRLRDLEDLGLVERVDDRASGAVHYVRTQKAIDLEPMLNEMALWAQKHIDAEVALSGTNLSVLMFKMRKIILVDELPKRRSVMQFRFSDDLEYNTFWAVAEPGKDVEICTSIPGYEVDLFVETSVTSLTAIIFTRSTVEREIEAGRLFLSGDALLSRTMQRWLNKCEYVPAGGAAQLGASHQRAAGASG